METYENLSVSLLFCVIGLFRNKGGRERCLSVIFWEDPPEREVGMREVLGVWMGRVEGQCQWRVKRGESRIGQENFQLPDRSDAVSAGLVGSSWAKIPLREVSGCKERAGLGALLCSATGWGLPEQRPVWRLRHSWKCSSLCSLPRSSKFFLEAELSSTSP